MSAYTDSIIREIEILREDKLKYDQEGKDTSYFTERLAELNRRLQEANEQLAGKQVLKG
jgi:hypothetical protein